MRDFAVLMDGAGRLSSFLSCGDDGAIKQWNTSFQCVLAKRAHRGPIRAMLTTVIPQVGTFVITGSDDTYINIWEVGDRVLQPVARVPCLVGVTSLHAVTLQEERTKNGAPVLVTFQALLSGHSDGSIRIWSMENLRALRSMCLLSGHTAAVRTLIVSPPYFVSGSYDNTIVVWSPESFRVVA